MYLICYVASQNHKEAASYYKQILIKWSFVQQLANGRFIYLKFVKASSRKWLEQTHAQLLASCSVYYCRSDKGRQK